MRKMIILLLLLISLVSCSDRLILLDEDGFRYYNFGGWLDTNEYIIQSHDYFMIDDIVYEEAIKHSPVLVENFQNKSINVRVSEWDKTQWYVIEPYECLTLVDE